MPRSVTIITLKASRPPEILRFGPPQCHNTQDDHWTDCLTEEAIFPRYEKIIGSDLMSNNVVQHHEFAPQLVAGWRYARDCRALEAPNAPPAVTDLLPEFEAPSDPAYSLEVGHGFDPAKLRQHMDGFIMLLVNHLHDELRTLTPEKMAAFTPADQDAFEKMIKTHVMGRDGTWFLCSVYGGSSVRRGFNLR